MPHKTEWLIEGRIMLSKYAGDLTIEELKQSNAEALHYLEKGQGPVHLLIDLKEQKSWPRNLALLRETLDVMRHKKLGWIIRIADSNSVNKMVAYALGQMFGARLTDCRTIKEACQFLIQRDLTLDKRAIRDKFDIKATREVAKVG